MELELNFLIDSIVSCLIAGLGISEFEAEAIAQLSWREFIQLIPIINQLREEKFGNQVRICAIVNAKSGRCPEDCKFCAQSAHWKTNIKTYPLLSPSEMVERAKKAKEMGAKKFSIVTSGKGINKKEEIEKIAQAVSEIRSLGLEPCASLGIVEKEALEELKQAGLVRYHHNLESSESFYPNICTTHSWQESLEVVKTAKELGLKVCCGGIFGLGEDWQDRIELAISLARLKPDSVPINFLIPIPKTPLENQKRLSPLEALKIIAIFRLAVPDSDIIICGGREKILGDFQSWIFPAGATGIIIGDYLTRKGRSPEDDLRMLQALGLEPKENELD